MTEAQKHLVSAVAGAITGLIAGLLYLSWVAPLATKLVLMGGILLILVVRRDRRLTNAAAFLTAAGLVSLLGVIVLGDGVGPTLEDALLPAVVLVVGLVCTVALVMRLRSSGAA